jgi:hypothetical protein
MFDQMTLSPMTLLIPFVQMLFAIIPFVIMPFAMIPFAIIPFAIMSFVIVPLAIMPFAIMPFAIMPIALLLKVSFHRELGLRFRGLCNLSLLTFNSKSLSFWNSYRVNSLEEIQTLMRIQNKERPKTFLDG